jgi:predicted metal-dependent phosphoesterase TrpH
MEPTLESRADLHCHSIASQVSKLGVQRALGLPECATPPEEVYELAKRRGMDFVTVTDHDTVDGGLALADRPDTFLSVELTAHFRGEPQAVHVLCWGITPDDFERLRSLSGDVERVAESLHERELACALGQDDDFAHADLFRRARHAHERGLGHAIDGALAAAYGRALATSTERREGARAA